MTSNKNCHKPAAFQKNTCATLSIYYCHSPNVSTTPLRQWGFRQCLPFSWTTLRGKRCWHPIAVMGVVDTFEQSHWATVSLNYSHSIKINIGPSNGGTIIPSIHCSIVLYWRLSDFSYQVILTPRTQTRSMKKCTYFLKRSTITLVPYMYTYINSSLL